jgi:hypothetical protein
MRFGAVVVNESSPLLASYGVILAWKVCGLVKVDVEEIGFNVMR